MAPPRREDSAELQVDPRVWLYASRLIVGACLFLAVTLGRPMHHALLPALVPYASLLALMLGSLTVGVAYGGLGKAGLAWVGGFAIAALPLMLVYSNTALGGLLNQDNVRGVPELLVRLSTLGGIGLFIGCERRWGAWQR